MRMKIWQKARFRSVGFRFPGRTNRFCIFVSTIAFLMGFSQADAAASATPRLLSPDLFLLKNTDSEIRLNWQIPDLEAERVHRVLLFVPGPVAAATCTVRRFEWQSIRNGEVLASGDDISFPTGERYGTKPQVYFRELGSLAGCRIAALQLTLGMQSSSYQPDDRPNVIFPSGEIHIEFQQIDATPFVAFPNDMTPIAQSLFLNHPPLRCMERKTTDSSIPPYLRTTSLKLMTQKEGIITIPARRLLDLPETDRAIQSLAFLREGTGIPFFVADRKGKAKTKGKLVADDVVYFYAPKSDSPYAAETATWFVSSPEHHLLITPTKSRGVNEGHSLFQQFCRLEEDHLFVEEHNKNEKQADYWMWHDFKQEGKKELSFSLPPTIEPVTAAIRFQIGAQPAYISLATDALTALYNGNPLVGVLSSVGAGLYSATATIGPDQLKSGTNELSIEVALKNTYSDPSVGVFLDWVEMDYFTRAYPCDQPFFPTQPTQTITIPAGVEWVWWIRNQGSRLEDVGLASGERKTAQLPNTDADWRIYFQSADAIVDEVTIEKKGSMESRSFSWHDDRQADVILIAPGEWESILSLFQSSLRREGYTIRFAAIEDIYDVFGDGRLSPYAIRSFLHHAFHHWANPKPSYVLLIGDATWDYWGRYRNGVVNIVPGFREHMLYAVENWFTRCDDPGDGISDMMIARWPVRSATELQTVMEKTIRYKENPLPGDWLNRLFLLTDDTFEQYSNELAEQWIPKHFRLTRRHIVDYPLIDNIYLPERLRASLRAKTSLEATKDILNIIEQGVFLWEFFGHGAPNVFGEERMFFGGGSKFSDVKKLTNLRRQPIIWAFTCETTSFDYPREKWNISIGEDLLTHPNGGAVTLIGATGRGYPSDHVVLARAMHEAAFTYRLRTQGQIFFAAQLIGLAYHPTFEPKDQFCILGDPTIAFPSFIPIAGEVESTDQGWDYTWTIPDEIQSAAGFTVWSATEGDVRIEQELASNPETIDHVKGRLSSDDTNIKTIGIDAFTTRNERIVVGHGSISLPPKETASAFIPATTGRLPDLTFQSDSIVVEPRSPRSGETIFVSATVRNEGKASAEDVYVSGFAEKTKKGKTPFKVVVGSQGAKVPRIDPGEEFPVRVRWDPTDNDGDHTLSLEIDSNKRIEEENEDNNTISTAINVRKKADLVFDVTRTKIEPINNGLLFQIYFEIVNQGESPAEKIVIEMALKQPNGKEIKQPIPKFVSLEPGERYSAGGIKIPADIEYFKMIIDPDEIVDEETHENNVFLYTPSKIGGN